MPSRLTQLRDRLNTGFYGLQKADLQRVYQFSFDCPKIALYGINFYVLSVSHPQVQFSNSGEFVGFISGFSKPGDISIQFLEDSSHAVQKTFRFWEGLKLNSATGIFYPKEVYADTAILTYKGSSSQIQSDGSAGLAINAALSESQRYRFTGFYPIQVDPISLAYADNNVLTINVTFNVDEVIPLNPLPF